MKSVRLAMMALLTMAGSVLFAQSTKTENIKVAGNCGSCKKKIDKAATITGVTKADWNKDSKVLTVTYDPAKVTNDAIQKSVAGVGYDTEKYKADDKAYNKLDECCQYERKKGK
ncbi:heavy-metal-associated domain-containing protein [Danxiaibacter flavus]|uniref:Heavy-metal-associated domain-containing protein n=1 Tax=Danxiaibacter flavus TaxID=3049108 RepID=A0ABV3ZD14_9BACT|nr:heavy-metal-associated domain-containing protein [Chitinophagaceae bacterium DXS]